MALHVRMAIGDHTLEPSYPKALRQQLGSGQQLM